MPGQGKQTCLTSAGIAASWRLLATEARLRCSSGTVLAGNGRMTAAIAFLKPFAVLAAIAFVAGFFGYLAMREPAHAVAGLETRPAVTAAPATGDWNLPKHI